MSENRSFYRKIVYVVLLAVLLFPLSYLGAPATREDEGGRLAALRDTYDLGQSDLGEIDPASETIRMATLGLRGIAVSMLWSKGNEYKKKEDWTNYEATLQQLAKLQPYFVNIWKFQAWNISYNVSVEVDDVRDRYSYVTRGIDFLKEGTKYIRDNPHLLAELGWFIGNKIGRADEHVDYRRLFKADEDFQSRFFDGNPPATPELRDNWLVSRGQYENAVSVVDDKHKSIGQKNPTTFFAAPAMSQINYSEAIEEEGVFQEKARSSWRSAASLWDAYGHRELRSSRGYLIRLADLNGLELKERKLQAEFDALSAEVRKTMLAEREAGLTTEQRTARAIPENLRTAKQRDLALEAEQALQLSTADVAKRVAQEDPAEAAQANRLASLLAETHDRVFLVRNNRQVANYEFWKTRCEFEQTTEALRARELAYAARQAFKEDADLLESRRQYEQSFALWKQVFAAFPFLSNDSTTGSDIVDYVEQYNEVLQQLDLSLSDPEVDEAFPLWEVLEANDQERKFAAEITQHKARLDDGADAAQSSPSEKTTSEPPVAESPAS